MQVQINSDNTISMHSKVSDSIGAYIVNVLGRFEPYLTRVEVYFADEANKNGLDGPRDKRCTLQARPRRHQTLVASAQSTDIDAAFARAATKLHSLLESTYGRLGNKRRRKYKMVSKTAKTTPHHSLAAG